MGQTKAQWLQAHKQIYNRMGEKEKNQGVGPVKSSGWALEKHLYKQVPANQNQLKQCSTDIVKMLYSNFTEIT